MTQLQASYNSSSVETRQCCDTLYKASVYTASSHLLPQPAMP